MTKGGTLGPFVLRGYIEQVKENDFFAICLTLNVTSRGRSIEEAIKNLNEAVNFYIHDAVEDDEITKWIPRHAPISYYLRYFRIWLRMQIRFCLPHYDAQLMTRIVNA